MADIVWTLPGYTAGRFPLDGSLRTAVHDAEPRGHAARRCGTTSQQYAQAEFAGVHPLAFHVHGDGVFHMREKPISTIADLKGLKLRAPTRQTNRMLAALGATPVAMPVPQVPEALGKGVIDGAVVP